MVPPRPGIRLGIVESESVLRPGLESRVDRLGWELRLSASPIPLKALVALRLDALIVDLDGLGPDAWAYLEGVCTRLPSMGTIVCSGATSVAQRVRGLRLGADDWVGKPIHPDELIARVDAIVRRRRRAESLETAVPVSVGELEIRADRFQALAGGLPIDLTRREFELIGVLVDAAGQVLEREAIYERVWGYAMVRGDRSVDVFVRKLRQKLERGSPGWRYIHTHFGIGYRFAAEPIEAAADVQPPRAAAAPAAPEVVLPA